MNQSDRPIKQTRTLDDGLYVALTGEIDLSRSPALRQELLDMTRGKPDRLIIDLNDVPYMDSSGVATLVETLQQLRRNQGRMILCNMQQKVRSIFEIARLDMVFTIVSDERQALEA